MRLQIRIFLSLTFCLTVDCLKILLYQPSFGHSHVNFVGKVADVLIDAGHHVVILQPDFNPNHKPGSKKAELIRISPNPEVAKTIKAVDEGLKVRWETPTFYFFTMAKMMRQFRKLNYEFCDELMQNETLIERLRGYNFDYAMSQPFDVCGFGIFHRLHLDKFSILLSTSISNSFSSMTGVPVALSYVPGMSGDASDRMTFWGRAKNTMSFLFEQFAVGSMISQVDDLIKKYDPEYPGGLEQLNRACFMMPNTEPLFEFPMPTIYKIINIGGISVPPPSKAKITEEWNEILNLRPHTILISFGSLSKSVDMPNDFKIGLVEAMKELPDVTFIWKYEDPSDEGVKRGAENIILNKWVPQTDLLSDERLSGFMTHAGAGSTNELVLRGKKAILIPMFGDQHHNARVIEKHGSSILLEKNDLKDQATLTKTIRQLLHDPELDKAAKHLAKMIAERPISPQEQLVKFTEFAAKHGPFPQLDPYGRQLSIFTFYLVDIIFSIIVIFFIFVFVLAYIFKKIFSRSSKTKTD
ncbi:unnamed protein product, partial [Mesorhabditis belari]|uniref:glucuronosyltransferase n=1 Tax=Mesorhabditis belari TaxID=2138241 RepID=A0AAF3F549_9BILA